MNPDYNDAQLVHLLNRVADYCIDAAHAIQQGRKDKAGDILQHAAHELRQLLEGEKT